MCAVENVRLVLGCLLYTYSDFCMSNTVDDYIGYSNDTSISNQQNLWKKIEHIVFVCHISGKTRSLSLVPKFFAAFFPFAAVESLCTELDSIPLEKM